MGFLNLQIQNKHVQTKKNKCIKIMKHEKYLKKKQTKYSVYSVKKKVDKFDFIYFTKMIE